jgi:hypothetical protein
LASGSGRTGSAQATRRKKARTLLHREVNQLLQALYGREHGKAAAKKAQKLSSKVKQELAQMKKEIPEYGVMERAHAICSARLEEMTGILMPEGGGFIDLGLLSEVEGTVHISADEVMEKRRLHGEHSAQNGEGQGLEWGDVG